MSVNNERTVPYYAVHKDGIIAGFFGPFSFLSNFYILENGVCVDGIYYPSVENAYQCYKYPPEHRKNFLDISPGDAKKLGREAPNFNAKKWDKNKVALMSALCRQKFINNEKLKKMLLMTEDAHLEERNSWNDQTWGTNESGIGQNNLGIILMTIRSDLQKNTKMW